MRYKTDKPVVITFFGRSFRVQGFIYNTLAGTCEELERYTDWLQTKDLHDKVRLITRQFKPETWAIEITADTAIIEIEGIAMNETVMIQKNSCNSDFWCFKRGGVLSSLDTLPERDKVCGRRQWFNPRHSPQSIHAAQDIELAQNNPRELYPEILRPSALRASTQGGLL